MAHDDEQPNAVTAELVDASVASGAKKPLAEVPPEPPVVARLVIEIRSDGTRTIARGAIEDTTHGEKVAVHAEGATPLALMLSLAKSIVTLPVLAASTMRAMLPRKGDKK